MTTAATAVHDDADVRLKRYLIAMGIRTLCFVLGVITIAGMKWAWGWLFVPAAVVLPYLAVVGANAHEPRRPGTVAWFDPSTDTMKQLTDRPFEDQ